MKKTFLLLSFSIVTFFASAASWLVGPTQTYTLPSQVRNLVQDGDTILIEGGTYSNDATKWVKKNLKIIGLGSGANRTILQYIGDIPNGKGIFVFETPGSCDDAYIENIVFDGAQVSDGDGANGAGIRFQANNLTVNNCMFMNCQNGILEGNGAVTTSNVVIENSEFVNNGYQLQNDPTYSGYEHHIYISASADTLLVRNCYFHHPRGQANSVKTRAQRAFILYNFIEEEASGYGSWELNIAQGGLNVIMGNVIIQSESGANHGIVGYDAATNALEDFYFVNNTVINRYVGNNKFFNVVPSAGINTFKIYNNIFASVTGASNTLFGGNIPAVLDSANNFIEANYLSLVFSNVAVGDYNLTSASTMLIDQGVSAGITTTGFPLTPDFMYSGFDQSLVVRNMVGTIDIGAYEYSGSVTANNSMYISSILVYPIPTVGDLNVELSEIQGSEDWIIELVDLQGKIVIRKNIESVLKKTIVETSTLSRGTYILKVCSKREVLIKKIVVNNN